MGYPEHEKLKALDNANQIVGDFLSWLGENGYEVAARHKHSDGCWGEKFRECGYRDGELAPVHRTVSQWLAAYFEIDENHLEQEKREMLRGCPGE